MGNTENSDKEEEEISKPIAVFGVLADIQYADADDTSDLKAILTHRKRHYRNSLNLVSQAIKDWQNDKLNESYKFSFLIQLGDLIDGCCKRNGDSLNSMNLVLAKLSKMFDDTSANDAISLTANTKTPRLLHVWGNHELYNFKRSQLINSPLNTSKALNESSNNNANYYALNVTDRLRLICLDMYEYSGLGYNSYETIYKSALETYRAYRNHPDHKKKYSQFRYCNGTISITQFEWLRDELNFCQSNKKRAIVCGHIPLHSNASHRSVVAWNAQEILDLFWSFGDTVIAYLAGHYHPGGYHKDEHNIHHLTLHAILETEPTSNSYLTVKTYKDKVKFIGNGSVKSFRVSFD
jgi:manganese-dependent ADP-ribose/CDP-alcohol diphosphatase